MKRKNIVNFVLIIILLSFSFTSLVRAQPKQLKLSSQANQAISDLAKKILSDGINPNINAIKPQLDPQDYQTVKEIGLLPDNPFYIFKSIGRRIRLFLTVGDVGKTYQLLKDGNEKTLEALLVTEKAANEKDATKQDQLTVTVANTLDSVGADFDSVAKTLNQYKKTDTIQAYLFQEEAFQFAGYYLKHQILLQKQQDRLSEKDYLLLESARVKHLSSIAHIVVGESRDPVLFGQQLSQLLSSEVGSNNTQLAAIAVLRDLENSANSSEISQLQNSQAVLQKEVEIKLSKLSKADRLKQIEQYIAFIHGNPIREFQAYNFLSKTFTLPEMNILTQALKDTAAQDFKKHLSVLDTADLQKQFTYTLFSNYPIDMRLLFYTEIQLTNNAAAKDQQKSASAKQQLERLQAVKSLLGAQVCQIYGKDAKTLTQTRFYNEATTAPSLLDVRVGAFLNESLQNCNGKTPETVTVVSDLRTKINNSFAAKAKTQGLTKLPTKAQAEAILKEENIAVSAQDEQKVAEKIEEEKQQIEQDLSENPTTLEEEILTIVEKITIQPQETVTGQTGTIVSEEEAIIEEIIQSETPTTKEVTVKEEQIIEEIVDAAETGRTSPLVEELPPPVQEEIAKETNTSLPTSTSIPSIVPTVETIVTQAPAPTSSAVTPTPVPITILEPVITTVQEQTAPATSESTPTPVPAEVVPGL